MTNDPTIEELKFLKMKIQQLMNQNMRLINRDVELTKKIGRCWKEIEQIKADIISNNREIDFCNFQTREMEESLKKTSKEIGKLLTAEPKNKVN